MILLEMKDYTEIREAYVEALDEGIGQWFKNAWTWLKDRFLNGDILKKVDELVAGAGISDFVDAKTGDLTPNVMTELEKPNVKEIFVGLRNLGGNTGAYYMQCLKFMEDGMTQLADQSGALKFATKTAQITAKEAGKAEGAPMQKETEAATKEMSGQVGDRIKKFDEIYQKAKAGVEKDTTAKIDALIKEVGDKKMKRTKALVEARFSQAKTALLLIEYDIKKKRLGATELDDLKSTLTAAYKESLVRTKALNDEIRAAKEGAVAEISMDEYNKLKTDVTAFAERYPVQAAKEGDNVKDKSLEVYNYEDGYIVITKYGANDVTFSRVTDDKLEAPETEDFGAFADEFGKTTTGKAPVAIDPTKLGAEGKTEAAISLEAYNKLDINTFMKEYPQVKADVGDDASEHYVYKWTDAMKREHFIVITGYSPSENNVYFKFFKDGKVIGPTDPNKKYGEVTDFDTFKNTLLSSNGGNPPEKIKGGVIEAEGAKTETGTTGEAAQGPKTQPEAKPEEKTGTKATAKKKPEPVK